MFNLLSKLTVLVLFNLPLCLLSAQTEQKAVVSAGNTESSIKLDGFIGNQEWKNSGSINTLKMIEPTENAESSFASQIMVLVDSKTIYLGLICKDPEPEKMVMFSKARDSELENEDYIKFVFDPYGDGRSAYIFAINPYGARYDALSSNRGEKEDPSWDGIWEAKTQLLSDGWSAEIRIPINSLTFRKGLTTWGFNVERKIQRLLEVDRWTAISRDYKTSTIR